MRATPTSTARAPAYFNRHTDVDLKRLFSAWKPDHGLQEIRRTLTATERQELEARATELRDGLMPYLSAERDIVKAQIAAMLGGFRSMRQQGEDVEGIVHVISGVLREFPAWAIANGCMKIARREAGLNPSFAPNDTEIHATVESVVREYRKVLVTAEALLAAPVETPRALPAPKDAQALINRPVEPRAHVPVREGNPELSRADGNHAARVAADLAARRDRRSSQQAAE